MGPGQILGVSGGWPIKTYYCKDSDAKKIIKSFSGYAKGANRLHQDHVAEAVIRSLYYDAKMKLLKLSKVSHSEKGECIRLLEANACHAAQSGDSALEALTSSCSWFGHYETHSKIRHEPFRKGLDYTFKGLAALASVGLVGIFTAGLFPWYCGVDGMFEVMQSK